MNLKWMIALGLLCMAFLAGCPAETGNPNEGRGTIPVDGSGESDSGSSDDGGGE
jgi:hypothetical protein